jgi:serine protease Do
MESIAKVEKGLAGPCRPLAGSGTTGTWARRLAASVLCAAAVFAAAPSVQASNRETPLVQAIKRVRPAVVNIHSQKVVSANESSPAGRMSGMGTGVVVDERGYIVTNYHVIEDVSSIRVTLVDGASFPAEVVARDQDTDLALLRIEAHGPLEVMPFGRSDDLMHGETVVAIGNAFGYEHTITQGIISELHRDVRLSATQPGYRDLIQTDASINPGNSGGPLINIDGEMIGLNVAIRAGAQGIGFAIPVDDVKRILSKLMSVRRLRGTWHGIVSGSDDVGVQVVVHQVEPGSPADRAGVKPGDRLVSVDGRQIQFPYDIERALLDKTARDEISMKVSRSELEKELRFALGPAPNGASPPRSEESAWNSLGMKLAPFQNANELRKYASDLRGGMLIKEVRTGSPADNAGLSPGDILVGMHQFETVSDSHVRYVLDLQQTERLDKLAFHVVREGRMYRGWINLSAR